MDHLRRRYFKCAQNEWMLSNPGKTLDMYQIAYLANKAYLNAFTLKNITSGFYSTGIYPLDRNIFDSSAFLCSSVTHLPCSPNNKLIDTIRRT